MTGKKNKNTEYRARKNQEAKNSLALARVIQDIKPIYMALVGESGTHYSTFKIYRDMGPKRSLNKTSQHPDSPIKCLRHIEELSSRWGWVERAKAYDLDDVVVAKRGGDDA